MDKLRTYLNGLSAAEKTEFAQRCGTSINYLRKAITMGHRLGDGLCIDIERESRGVVRCEDLRPAIDWAYLRGTAKVIVQCASSLADPSTDASSHSCCDHTSPREVVPCR